MSTGLTINDAIEAHEAMSPTEKKLVGEFQEQRLRADQTGGEDGMWFIASVETVATIVPAKTAN